MPMPSVVPSARSLVRRGRALSVAALALLGACQDDGALTPVQLATPLPADAVQAVVQQLPGAEAGTTEYVVRVVGRARELAAYQGAVTFDPTALEVVTVRTPTALADGETHVVNREDLPTGRVRFAAYVPETFASDEALRLVVRPRVAAAGAARAAPLIAVELDAGGTTTGTPLGRAQLRASAGVHDRDGRLLR